MEGSASRALMSLIRSAPASSARRATDPFVVSTEIGMLERSLTASTTGRILRHSSSLSTA